MMPSDPHEEVNSNKYNIQIEQAKGFVIGDNAHLEQHIYVQSDPAHNTEQKRNRSRLLAKVRAFWITEVFEQSLHGQALMALGLSRRHDFANPWHFVLQMPNQAEQQLKAGTRITEVYDDAGGELLILGEPGSGKTTLLLELTRNLLERAEEDESQLMPLVFNLSSWAVRRQSLDDWLVEEMNTRYQVPRSLAQTWVASEQVLPLLDGLDEVAEDVCDECVQAINAYHLKHGLIPLVVCSRKSRYIGLSSRVELGTTATVLPLTLAQVDTYLSQAGGSLAAVEVALHQDKILQELAETPLMLNILAVIYTGKSAQEPLIEGSLEVRRQAIFTEYIEQMLRRRSPVLKYPGQRTIQWLGWLAWQMRQHSLSVFYIEELQTDWLLGNGSRLVYHTLTGLIFGIVVGLVGGSIIGLILGLFFGLISSLTASLIGGLIFGSAIGLFGGLVVGLRGGSDSLIQPTEGITWSYRSFLDAVRSGLKGGGLFAGLVVGLAAGLAAGLIVGLIFGPFAGIFVGLFCALFFSVVVTVILGLKGEPNSSVQPGVRNRLFSGLNGVLIAGLRRGLIGGLLSRTLDVKTRITPNQGMRRSAKYAGITALIFGGIFGLIGGLIGGLVGGLFGGLSVGGVVGLSAALSAALIFGGEACTKHIILRLLLWQTGAAPWHYPRFLDFAAERILLRKVGGGYIFIHRSLLEYFATLYEEQFLR